MQFNLQVRVHINMANNLNIKPSCLTVLMRSQGEVVNYLMETLSFLFMNDYTNQQYKVEELGKLLIVDPILSERMCTKQPVWVCKNASFVVDLHSLDDPQDVRADENGVWQRNGSPVAYVSIHNSSGNTRVLKRSKMGHHSYHFKLTRTYYCHTSSPDFTRIITTVHGKCVAVSETTVWWFPTICIVLSLANFNCIIPIPLYCTTNIYFRFSCFGIYIPFQIIWDTVSAGPLYSTDLTTWSTPLNWSLMGIPRAKGHSAEVSPAC